MLWGARLMQTETGNPYNLDTCKHIAKTFQENVTNHYKILAIIRFGFPKWTEVVYISEDYTKSILGGTRALNGIETINVIKKGRKCVCRAQISHMCSSHKPFSKSTCTKYNAFGFRYGFAMICESTSKPKRETKNGQLECTTSIFSRCL